MSIEVCQCPTCGRMHKSMGFGKPPEAIASPSLLHHPELAGSPPALCNQIARAMFGPQNHIWDKRWDSLHDNGLKSTEWSGEEPIEGKAFYRHQAMVALEIIKRKCDTRLNNYLVDMKPGYDDSITGFNEAWDVIRAVFNATVSK